MKNKFLLPYQAKYIGLPLAVIGAIWLFIRIFKYHLFVDPVEAIAKALTMIGLLIFMFSKEKCEDELINQIRLRSFFSATLFTCIYILLFIIAGFAFDFGDRVSGYTAISFLQAFYLGYFYYLMRKYNFFQKSK